jgi:23S rRNA pseudouridine1911/1915/1917 synthase
MPAHEFEATEEDDGERLDVVLARRVEGLGRARAKALAEEGQVEVEGRRRSKSYRLSTGERVVIAELPPSKDFYCEPDSELPLVVLAETDRFVIVDKAAGVPSHPLRAGERGTLAGSLVARYPEMRDIGYSKREPGILHRLDTGTSGVMLAARTPKAFEELRDLLQTGRIEKRYLARCVGEVVAPQVIETPIANDPRDKRKVRACTDPREIKRLDAQPARTEVLSSTAAPEGSLVELSANHARRHQVRVHLASIGHPLLGDPLYGGPENDLPHHLLHASAIRIEGTWTHSPWGHAAPLRNRQI